MEVVSALPEHIHHRATQADHISKHHGCSGAAVLNLSPSTNICITVNRQPDLIEKSHRRTEGRRVRRKLLFSAASGWDFHETKGGDQFLAVMGST